MATRTSCRWCDWPYDNIMHLLPDHEAHCPRRVKCPTCHARPSEPCFGLKPLREHRSRQLLGRGVKLPPPPPKPRPKRQPKQRYSPTLAKAVARMWANGSSEVAGVRSPTASEVQSFDGSPADGD